MKFIILSILVMSCATEKTLTEKLQEKKTSGRAKTPSNIKLVMTNATENLKKSKIVENSAQVGTMVPDFKIEGKSIKSFYSKKPTIIKFYRGYWCPYCQLELVEYEKYKKQIEDKGYQVVILTPDTKLNIKKFKDKQKVSFDIYQDKNNYIAKKFGIAFKLDPRLTDVYNKFGIDLVKSQGNNKNELPIPGTYIINTKGEIIYSYLDPDYTNRLDPLDLLKQL